MDDYLAGALALASAMLSVCGLADYYSLLKKQERPFNK